MFGRISETSKQQEAEHLPSYARSANVISEVYSCLKCEEYGGEPVFRAVDYKNVLLMS
jgi:hypothetical protein